MSQAGIKQILLKDGIMIYYVDKGKLLEGGGSKFHFNQEEPYLCLFNEEELLHYSKIFHISNGIVKDILEGHSFKFESYEGFDLISLNIPTVTDTGSFLNHITIYFRKNLLIFVCANPEELTILERIESDLENEESEKDNLSLGRILELFFDYLTKTDSVKLDHLEEKISSLEESIMTSRNKNYITEIVHLRKKLMGYKRYYDRLLSVTEAIVENVNGLLSKKEMRYFQIITDRNRRLLESLRFLQDYLSQIREAYQTQVDINLNSIMKLSTVITTIFLPLTLVAGWYGMNFDMPEYHLSFGYPMVIVGSLVLSLLIIIYFKKHKWF
ncbi:magnesium transporter [Anaerocolumna aminovalerica]|nr:CorA family divalent cation transporter [Anaerocolumna aminovalerica]MBU5331182.1 magnesium transporter [Anaerocolumna aminovalerica]